MKNEIRKQITSIIEKIEPFDETEQRHQQDALRWIQSGVEIFRIEKPAVPAKHLVCYNILFDAVKKKLLIFEHRGSGLLLPCGGHVNTNELPRDAAIRELKEELNRKPHFIQKNTAIPFFISQVTTVGALKKHIDVDLWYVHTSDSTTPLDTSTGDFQREFAGYKWLTFDECTKLKPGIETDTNLLRFVKKLKAKL